MIIEKKIKLSKREQGIRQEAADNAPRVSRFINDGWREKGSEDRRSMGKNILIVWKLGRFPTDAEIRQERWEEFLKLQGGTCMKAVKV